MYATIRRFLLELVGMISLDRNDREVTNLLFVLLRETLAIVEQKIVDVENYVARHSNASGIYL